MGAVVVYTAALFLQIKRQQFIPHLFNALIDEFTYQLLIFQKCRYVDNTLLIVFIVIVFYFYFTN